MSRTSWDIIDCQSLRDEAALVQALIAEAVAEDGLIEAYRVGSASNFAYAVQWHPEWKYWDNDVSQAIFEAFGAACRERRMRRNQ